MYTRDIAKIDLLIAKNIERIRQDHKMSQRDMAELLGISECQLNEHESATNRISASRLHQIACIFEVSVDCFFDKTMFMDMGLAELAGAQ